MSHSTANTAPTTIAPLTVSTTSPATSSGVERNEQRQEYSEHDAKCDFED